MNLEQIKATLPKDKLYKRCGRDIIIVLEYTNNTQHNEERKGIVDINFAKFRASELNVIDILNISTNERLKSFAHSWSNSKQSKINIKYTINEIIKPNKPFDENIQKVCASGIHYFKSIDAAFYYIYVNKNFNNYSGDWIISNPNGSIHERHEFENNKVVARYNHKGIKFESTDWKSQTKTFYYSNGAIKTRSEFRILNGIKQKHGEYRQWSKNETILTIGKYTCDHKSGNWEHYFSNGGIESIGRYFCGKKIQLWKFFDENEQLVLTRYYKSGIPRKLKDNEKI